MRRTWNAMRFAVLATATTLAGCATDEPTRELGTPVTVATGASNPTVAVSPDGSAIYLAWVGAAPGDGNVYVARSADGVNFEPPVRVNDRPGDAAPHEQAPAQIDIGPQGEVYVAWQKNTPAEGRRFPWSDVRFARSLDGGRSFEPAITVNDDAGGPPASHTFHDLMVAPDGTVFVSWIDGRGRSEDEAMNHEHNEDAKPGSLGPQIRVARSTDRGATFAPSVGVAVDACPCCRTALAIDDAGQLYVAWRTVLPGNIRDVVVARSQDGGATWTRAERVHNDDWSFDACPHAGPSIAVDRNGRLHAAWYTGASGRSGIYMASSTDAGASFGNPHAILSAHWVPPSQIKLAVDEDRLIVAWDDRREAPPALNIDIIATVTGETMAHYRAGTGASPAVAAANGRAIVAWLAGDTVRALELGTPTRRAAR